MDSEATPPPRPRRLWWRWLIALPLLLAVLLALGLWGLDTDAGHRFLIDRIAALQIKSGLRIRIGRIDGSIYGRARLHDVRLYDPQGRFLSAPDVALDWHPAAWLRNKLDIDRLTAPTATLEKLPKLRPGKGPVLPGFDIRIGRLAIDRLRIAPGIAGPARAGKLALTADIRHGRALLKGGLATTAGDRLRIDLDAEPDRDRFDLSAALQAPAGGLLGKLLKAKRPLAAQVAGRGRWSAWAGTGRLEVGGARIADLALGVQSGRYTLHGTLDFATVTHGRLQRLSAPKIAVDGSATLANRQLQGTLKLRSAALAVVAEGGLDLARGAYDAVKVRARLLQAPALFPNMRANNVELRALFNGAFATAHFRYQIDSPRLFFDRTGFERVRVAGEGRLSRAPVTVPVRLTAARVTGVGEVAGGILANLQVDGLLRVTAKDIIGDGLRFRSDKLTSRVNLFVDLVSGDFNVSFAGELNRYYIPGFGIVDVRSTLKVVPAPDRRGTRVIGRAQAWVRRFDNSFLAYLAGGLPQLDTGLERDRDGILHFVGLRIVAPKLRLTGSGYRRRDGTLWFEGGGEQATYGPVKLTLDGRIERPKLDIALARPLDALGLAQVRLLLDPTDAGYAYKAAGGSTLGPWTSGGAILLPKGAPARIAVAALDVAGMRAHGELVSAGGGFDGKLDVAGTGLTGNLRFDRQGTIQRIAASFDAHDARLATAPETLVRRGGLDGEILLDPAGPDIRATVTARGLRHGPLTLAQLAADVKLKNGRGQVKAAIAGVRGRAFDLQGMADVAPDRLAITGGGTIDRQPVKLQSRALLTRESGGWRLAPASLAYGGGTMTVGGLFGAEADAFDASLSGVPMNVFDIFFPNLGLGGNASGKIAYRASLSGTPSGEVDLTIRNLSRSGLVLSSKPIDVGFKGMLNGSVAAARAVAASGGKIIGRAQAKLAPLGSGDLPTRLMEAPLFAQLRYAGPADTLWRLTGIETFDLSGPVEVAADAGGRLSDPRIVGSLRTSAARLESTVTGTVLTDVKATGRFGGSRLVIDTFTATAGQGGSVSGSGAFDLSAAHGFGMDLRLQASHAVLINRDDLGATVTGPFTIRSDGAGGTIAGDVTLDRSRFRLGRARAAQSVPQLKLTELNRSVEEAEPPAPPTPWRLALKAKAPNRLMVTGLGLDSEWRATLDIGGTVTEPTLLGTATLFRGGYQFAGRRFDLDHGTIRFNGSNPPDPVLDIVAQAGIQGLNATIRVQGTGLKPEISFTSVPALPEDELLSRLLFGTSITNLSAPEALQLASAVAALQGGGGLDPINAVRRAVGLDRLRILPADPTIGQGTAIAAGKYVTRRAFVELVTDGQGYTATRIEYQITRWLSLLSTISSIGRESANIRVSKDY